jgi:hypothetical protein
MAERGEQLLVLQRDMFDSMVHHGREAGVIQLGTMVYYSSKLMLVEDCKIPWDTMSPIQTSFLLKGTILRPFLSAKTSLSTRAALCSTITELWRMALWRHLHNI